MPSLLLVSACRSACFRVCLSMLASHHPPRFQTCSNDIFFSIALAGRRRPAQERKDRSVPMLVPTAPRFLDSGSAVPCRLDAISERVELGGLVIRETGEKHLFACT